MKTTLAIAMLLFSVMAFADIQVDDNKYISFGTDNDIRAGFNGTLLRFIDPSGNVLATLEDKGTTGEFIVTGKLSGDLSSPPPIGGTTPNTGAFSSLTLTDTFQWGGVNYYPPATDGTTGQVLTTDGSGQTSWQTASGGGGTNYWQRVGTTVSPLNAGDSVSITSGSISSGTQGSVSGRFICNGSDTDSGYWQTNAPSTAPNEYWDFHCTNSRNFFFQGAGGSTNGYVYFTGSSDIPKWRFVDGSITTYQNSGVSTLTLQSLGSISMGGGSGQTIALNADTISDSRPTITLFAANNVNSGASGKTWSHKGALNVVQGVDFDSTMNVDGISTFVGNIASIRGVAYSWPSAHGNAGDQLTTDASGNLTWAAASGSNLWTLLGGVLSPTTSGNDLTIDGGDLKLGANDTTRGTAELYNGTVNSAPGDLILHSADGTPYHIFVNDAGDGIRIAASAPTSNTDGALPSASAMRGSGSTTDAVDLATAEVSGTLPASSVGNGLTDTQVNNDLTLNNASIDNSIIGAVTPSSAVFTDLTVEGTAELSYGLFLNESFLIPEDKGTGLLMGYGDVGVGEKSMVFSYDSDTESWDELLIGGSALELGASTSIHLGCVEDNAIPCSLTKLNVVVENGHVALGTSAFDADDTTPSVESGNVFTVPNTWTTSHNITALDGGAVGQTIRIRGGDADCVIEDGTGLELAGNWTATPGNTITLTMYSEGVWTEDCRSGNS